MNAANTATPTSGNRSGTSKTAIWLMACLVGLFVLQKVQSNAPKRLSPGPGRGDVVLEKEDLPAEIGLWKQVKFQPAPPPETLPRGQYWWVHHWVYQSSKAQALITLDQLGEEGWHELTYCYRNQGQQILERTLRMPSANEGPVIEATMKNSQGQKTLLLFSVFFEDGTWGVPPDVDLEQLNRDQHKDQTLTGRLTERVAPTITFAASSEKHERALQCQLLLQCEDPEQHRDDALQLHLQTREAFRQTWLKHKSGE